MFAFVYWYKVNPRATWFHPCIIVASPDMVMNGPAVFLPNSRIFAPCAIISDEVNFDYGVDHVPIELSCHTSFVIMKTLQRQIL